MKFLNHKTTIKLVFVFSLLVMFLRASSQSYDDIIKDLEQKLSNHLLEDETKVDFLNEISYAYRRSSPEKIEEYAKGALELAEKLNYIKGMGIAYKNLGIAISKKGTNRDTVLFYFKKCYQLAEQGKDYYTQAACSNNLGYVYRLGFEYDKGIEAYLNALEIHSKHFPVDRLS